MSFNVKKNDPGTGQKRIEYLDIARGIGLLLVTWAHSRAPFYNKIYLFHMPFFILLSGYLHKPDTEPLPFVKKRIFSLYVPFVFWNILTTVIRTLGGIYGVRSMLKLIPKILLTLDKDGTLLGATWFLPALFLISVSYKLLERLFSRIPQSDILLTVLYLGAAVLGFSVTFPFKLSRTLVLSFFYAVGALLKKRNVDIRNLLTLPGFIISAACFVCLARVTSANMGNNRYSSPVLFILTSFLGSYVVLWIASRLETTSIQPLIALRKFDIFISRWAVYIILFTFIGAYIVNILTNLPLEVPLFTYIKENPAVGDSTRMLWLLYFEGSTMLPVFIGYFLNLGLPGKALRAIHAIPEITRTDK